MDLMRSKHGKAALVIGGNAIIKFITIDAKGPTFESMGYREFRAEYDTKLKVTEYQALLSFLKAAKKAYKHNPEVIHFLMENLMKNFSEMTHDELIMRYNELCTATGKKPKKSFDSKKAVLKAIEELDAEVQVPTAEQEAAAQSTSRRSSNMTDAATGQPVEKKPRGKGIGARAKELLLAGKETKEIIDTIKAEIEGANPTPATIAWYKNKLRQDGLLAKPVKKDKTPAAAPAATGEGEAPAEGEQAAA